MTAWEHVNPEDMQVDMNNPNFCCQWWKVRESAYAYGRRL